MPRSVRLLLVVVCLWVVMDPVKSVLPDDKHVSRTSSAACRKGKEYLLFDFTSPDSLAAVKALFGSVTVVYGFKVYGVKRYLFITDNNENGISTFNLPENTVQTPIEKITFLNDSDPFIDNEVLTFVERTWSVAGLEKIHYTQILKDHMKLVSDVPKLPKVAHFMSVAAYPIKAYLLFKAMDSCIEKDLLSIGDDLGQLGPISTRVLKIYKIAI